jgi:ribosomal protein L19
MEPDKSFIGEFIGKPVWVAVSVGVGTKDASAGNYKGVLLGFDGQFLKLEYDIRTYVNGVAGTEKAAILINSAHVITIEAYRESLNV